MGKQTGLWCGVYFAGYNLTGRARQWNLAAEWDDVDAATFQDGVHNSIPGLVTTTADAEAFLDQAALSTHEALKLPLSRAGQILMIPVGVNAAPAIGDLCLAVAVDQFSYNAPIGVAAALIASAKWKARSRPGFGIVLADTTITDTAAFAGVDEGAASALGGGAYLEIITPVVADSYVVKVQHSVLGSIWVDLATFTANGQTRTSETIAVAGAIYQHVRAIATRTGSAGEDLRLAVALARHNS